MKQLLHIPPLWHPFLLSRILAGNASLILHMTRRQLALRPEQALLQLEEICYSRLCKPVLCCQTYYTDFFDFAMVRKLL